MTPFDQGSFELRCEWGAPGVAQLAPESDAVVIVDVLSFCTCVDIAAGRGALLYPCCGIDESAAAFAAAIGAQLAGGRGAGGYSLSPASLREIPPGTKLVLPSPNGATLSLATGTTPTFAGCLRNAGAVAAAARAQGRRIAVVPAGERWSDRSLRPAIEDLLGAGAILVQLPGSRSPEAQMAVAAFERFRSGLAACLRACGSGRELIERGFAEDVELAGALEVSPVAPRLANGAYVAQQKCPPWVST